MTKCELIERMKRANAAGNFGIPDGIIAEWIDRNAASGHYATLIDPTTNEVIAQVPQTDTEN